MKQSSKKSKSNSEAPILTSPEGVKIQITAGRKLQMIRSFAHDPEITDAQFRALVCITDRLNEGRTGDESRWGSAYPNYETIAKDIAKDVRSAKRVIKELETGQRETNPKNGERKLVPCKAVLNVKRTKNGDADESNEYRLKNWGAFAVASRDGAFTAPPQSEEGAVTGQEGCGHPSKGVRSPVDESPVTAPDSSHGPRSETHPKDPSQSAPASGERGPAVDLNDDRQPSKPANDNPQVEPWPDDIEVLVDKFQSYYPKGGDRSKIAEALEEIRREGKAEFEDILRGASNYKRENAGTEPKYLKNPENFLKERLWTGYQQDHRQRPRPAMAI